MCDLSCFVRRMRSLIRHQPELSVKAALKPHLRLQYPAWERQKPVPVEPDLIPARRLFLTSSHASGNRETELVSRNSFTLPTKTLLTYRNYVQQQQQLKIAPLITVQHVRYTCAVTD